METSTDTSEDQHPFEDQNSFEDQYLLKKSARSAELYLEEAVKHIDRLLGKGYARAHPDLVATFMKVAGQDFSDRLEASDRYMDHILEDLI